LDARKLAPGIAAFVAAMLVSLIGPGASADPSPRVDAPSAAGTVKLRLLGVNDLHGHLEPPRPGVGGAAWLDAHLDRATIPARTIRVHAGDMVGASPLVSSWFHDEPAIEAANSLDFDVGTLGNHEFDEGGDELLRLLRGGRRKGPDALKRAADGALVNTSSPEFAGAAFPYIASNTIDRDGELLLPPYRIVERAGVQVGFVGVTTESTPHFLLPRHSRRFGFTDISEAVNRWVPELRHRGVEAIVVLAHSGAAADPSDAAEATGEIVDEVSQMSDAVDVVIAGHSHSLLNLRVGNKLVVEALSYGVAFDQVDMEIDRASGDVITKRGEVPATTHAGITPDAATGVLVDRYAARVAPLGDRVLTSIPAPLTRANGLLGDAAAVAQLAAADADLALVNPGSLRADLPAGEVTYAEAFEVHPYDFDLLRIDLPGRVLDALLASPAVDRLYAADRVGAIDPDRTYTVVANELLATGATLPSLAAAAGDAQRVGTEAQALAEHLESR
jgi:5'-nucleotidase